MADFKRDLLTYGGINYATGNMYNKGNIRMLGNGSFLTELEVEQLTVTGNAIIPGIQFDSLTVAGNVECGGNFIGNGALISGVTSSLPSQANLDIIGNVTAAGNITAEGQVNVTGNVIGSYFIGNGSQLTGLLSGLPATGNIDIRGNVTAAGNIVAGGQVNVTGNVIGNYFIGNGALLTGLPTANAMYLSAGRSTNQTISSGTWSNIYVTFNEIYARSGVTYQGGFLTLLGGVTYRVTSQLNWSCASDYEFLYNMVYQGNDLPIGASASSAYSLSSGGTNNNTSAPVIDIIITPPVTTQYSFRMDGSTTAGTGEYIRSDAGTFLTVVALNNSYSSSSSTTLPATANIDIRGNVVAPGNISAAGQVNVTGNVIGNYFIGNGALLTGLSGVVSTANARYLSAGRSNNQYAPTGGVWGNATVVMDNTVANNGITYNSSSGLFTLEAGVTYRVTSQLRWNAVEGDIFRYGLAYANGTMIGGSAGSALVYSDNVTIGTGNNASAPIVDVIVTPVATTSYCIKVDRNVNAANTAYIANIAGTFLTVVGLGGGFDTSLPSTGNIDIRGNVTAAGNITAAGQVNVVGNVTAGYFIGNGSRLIGVTATLPSTANLDIRGNVIASGNITAAGQVNVTGNVVGNYFIGNGSQLTGLLSSLPATANIDIRGNVTAAGNITAAGQVNVTGNVVGNYFIGNGSRLTGLTATTLPATANIDIRGNVTAAGNITAAGQVTVTGNVTAGYFIGNGALLTGLSGVVSTANARYLSAGRLTPQDAPYGGVWGNATVVMDDVFANNGIAYNSSSGLFTLEAGFTYRVTSQLRWTSDPAAIFQYGLAYANGTTVGGSAGSALVYTPNFTAPGIGNNTSAPVVDVLVTPTTTTSYCIKVSKNVNLANVAAISNGSGTFLTVVGVGGGFDTSLPSTGNIDIRGNVTAAGNITAAGQVNVVGNVTAGYFIGNGSQLIGVTATLPSTANIDIRGNVTATGNVTAAGQVNVTGNVVGNYFIGNGSQLTGLLSSLPTTANIDIRGNVTASGNITAAGQVNVTGNVVGNYFIGNGSQLTGLLSSLPTTANIDIRGNVTASGNITAAGQVNVTGNVVGNYFIGNGSQLTGLTATTLPTTANIDIRGNVTASGNITAAGQVTVTGNVTGNYFIGNGALLTGLTGVAVAGNARYISAGRSNPQYPPGGLWSNATVVMDNVVANNGITYNSGSGLFTLEAGVTYRVTSQLWWNATDGTAFRYGLAFANGTMVGGSAGSALTYPENYPASFAGNNTSAPVVDVIVTPTTTTNYCIKVDRSVNLGNTASISNIAGTFLTVVGLGNGFDSGLPSTGNIDIRGNVTAAGNITAAGQVNVTGNVVGNYFIGNGSQLTGLTATTLPALANIDIRGNVTASGNITAAGQVNVTGNVVGNYFIGNGSQLTGLLSSLPAIANIDIRGNVTASGNITAAGQVNVTGNVVGNYFIGNGALLTGVTAAGVTSFTANGNTISASNLLVVSDRYLSINVSSNVSNTTGLIVTTNGINTGGNLVSLSNAGYIRQTNLNGYLMVPQGWVQNQAERLAVFGGNAPIGTFVTQVDTGNSYILTSSPSNVSNSWFTFNGVNFPVNTVFGRVGDVIANYNDYTDDLVALSAAVGATPVGNSVAEALKTLQSSKANVSGSMTGLFLGNLIGSYANVANIIVTDIGNIFTLIARTGNVGNTRMVGGNVAVSGQVNALGNIVTQKFVYQGVRSATYMGNGSQAALGNVPAVLVQFPNVTLSNGNLDLTIQNASTRFINLTPSTRTFQVNTSVPFYGTGVARRSDIRIRHTASNGSATLLSVAADSNAAMGAGADLGEVLNAGALVTLQANDYFEVTANSSIATGPAQDISLTTFGILAAPVITIVQLN